MGLSGAGHWPCGGGAEQQPVPKAAKPSASKTGIIFIFILFSFGFFLVGRRTLPSPNANGFPWFCRFRGPTGN
jgi:hypothetical protein